MLADDEVRGLAADGLGRHDFVGFAVLQHAVLMDAGLMRKGVAAHDGLVGGDGAADDERQQAAGRIELLVLDAAVHAVHVGADLHRHDDFFQRGIARTFADAAKGHFGLTGTVLDSAQAVGDGEPKVVVTVHAEHGLVGIRGVFDDVFDQLAVFVGLGIADGVGDVDGGGPGVDDLGEHADEEIRIGARGVFGGKFHVVGILGGMAHGGDSHFHDLIRGLAELVLHVDGRRGEEDVDTRVARPVQRLPCAVDVVLVAAGERGDLHVGDGVGDGMNGFKVAHAGGRETGFDDVHAKAFQLTRHTELFLEVHGSAGGLLAIAERRVENNDAIGHGILLGVFQPETVRLSPDAARCDFL